MLYYVVIQFHYIFINILNFFSPSKKSIRNEILSPTKKIDPETTQQRPFISPRKVVVSPIKSPNKVCYPNSLFTNQLCNTLTTQ